MGNVMGNEKMTTKKGLQNLRNPLVFLGLAMGLEPTTSEATTRCYQPTELRSPYSKESFIINGLDFGKA